MKELIDKRNRTLRREWHCNCTVSLFVMDTLVWDPFPNPFRPFHTTDSKPHASPGLSECERRKSSRGFAECERQKNDYLYYFGDSLS